jgi:YD repeat-containing protein
MSVSFANIELEHHVYDARGDVVYLAVRGYDAGGLPTGATSTPEGHGIEYDDAGHVVALTLVNAKSLVERDGELRITWPDGHVSRDNRSVVLTPAA